MFCGQHRCGFDFDLDFDFGTGRTFKDIFAVVYLNDSVGPFLEAVFLCLCLEVSGVNYSNCSA